jgi:hypothetical protein
MAPIADAFAPVLVVGAGRSGTTLLAELLARHSRVAIPPETQFFVALANLRLDPARRQSEPELRAMLAKMKRLGEAQLDVDALLSTLGSDGGSAVDLFAAALDQFTRRSGKTRAGEKTPGHLFHVPALLSHYPGARVVAIVRDPRDMAASYARVEFGPRSAADAAVYWRCCTQAMFHHADRYPDRFTFVRYEDLLTQTEARLRQIDAFLGLDFEPGQLDPATPTGVLLERERAWKGRVKEPIDPTRAYAWRREMDGGAALAITSITAPWLSRLGYDDAPLRSLSWRGRWLRRRQGDMQWRQLSPAWLARHPTWSGATQGSSRWFSMPRWLRPRSA